MQLQVLVPHGVHLEQLMKLLLVGVVRRKLILVQALEMVLLTAGAKQ